MKLLRCSSLLLLICTLFSACASQNASSPTQTAGSATGEAATAQPTAQVSAPPATTQTAAAPSATETQLAEATAATLSPAPPYDRTLTPQVRRSETSVAALERDEQRWKLTTGQYTLESFQADTPVLIRRTDTPGALALRFLGGLGGSRALPLLPSSTVVADDEQQLAIRAEGRTDWASYTLQTTVYPFVPGLMRYTLVLTRTGTAPNGTIAPELTFVDPATGEETAAGYTAYADPAAYTAPLVYGYAKDALRSSLFYFLDRTALNPFAQLARFAPGNTPQRSGRSLGHLFPAGLLSTLPANQGITLYDSYLALAPDEPSDENEQFTRFLQGLGATYDLIAKPVDEQQDWRDLAEKTIRDLDNPEASVTIDGKRYLRAYISDTRQSAELITQLDVLTGLRRYERAFNVVLPLADQLSSILPDFYAEDYGMMVNGGPIQLGLPTKFDSWYEMGHHLKLAELALLGDATAKELILKSAPTLIEWGQAVDYRFHQFVTPKTWQGTGREPDVAGCYAYTMLLLHELTNEQQYLDEAKAALEQIAGNGFKLAYETHITAQSIAAGARMYTLTNDEQYLNVVNAALANVLRLTWLWESDYGAATAYRTFWGLGPTQASGVSTPKEQYEAWIYIREAHNLLRGKIDPDIEKLLAEFVRQVPQSSAYSLPPLLPPGAASANPGAYPTVKRNDLSLYIPLEDVREGFGLSGVIGQEVYGAGMAPTYAALLK